jgi:SAM-dependent methyltransferase
MWWQIKWSKNAAFGLLPCAGMLRRAKRRLRPYPNPVSEWTLEEGFRLLEFLREGGCQVDGATVLEVGSGWHPVIPLLFSLANAKRVVMVDSQRLIDGATFFGTVLGMEAHAQHIAARIGIDEAVIRSALADPPGDLGELLRRFRMDYRAPCDLAASSIPDGEFNVVFSRALLEHVPPDVLRPLLDRTFRLLRPGGWTCHAVDNSDHWSHSDRRLSRLNFLCHSDRFFGFLTWFNPLDYQNRLRHPEYADLLQKSGFEVVYSMSIPEPKALADLQTLSIAARFRGFVADDLARLDSYFLARHPPLQAATA